MKQRLMEMFDVWARRIGRGLSERDLAELAKAIAILELAEAVRGLHDQDAL